ncbi:MAG: hypothetical protein IJ757_03515 [Clostridiales bacterium]|nr:hypothetical protein [Clostridiales bacterium]
MIDQHRTIYRHGIPRSISKFDGILQALGQFFRIFSHIGDLEADAAT